ncbi:MAG: hypothetical protein ABIS68_10765 [Casimicrobiaceae bacterium]
MPYDKNRSFRYPLETRADHPVRNNSEGKTWTWVAIFLVVTAVAYAGSSLPDRPDDVVDAPQAVVTEVKATTPAPADIYRAEPAPDAESGNVPDLTY